MNIIQEYQDSLKEKAKRILWLEREVLLLQKFSQMDERATTELCAAVDRLEAENAALRETVARAERDALRELVADGNDVVRGADAAIILREIQHGTPDTPERVQRVRDADRIFAENQRLMAENHRLRHPPISPPSHLTPARPTDTGRVG